MAKEGERVVLECWVDARPEPIVKWYREGIEIQNTPDYTITFQEGVCTLIILEVFPEDAGKFTCVATNAEGRSVSEAFLQVERECQILFVWKKLNYLFRDYFLL